MSSGLSGRRFRRGTVLLLGASAVALAGSLASRFAGSRDAPPDGAPAAVASFVGSQACAACHALQHTAWQASNHHRAMQSATAATVLGDFNDASLRYFGRETRFSRRGDAFLVTTEVDDGRMATVTAIYTLGVAPLQQYLVTSDDGRIQALPFAWDTRPRDEGGQRWFHLYPEHDVTHDDPLFWTRPLQNWNHMCGDCHTTNFAKGFIDGQSGFVSTWSELGNGCESCHGAGSTHVETMRAGEVTGGSGPINSLRGQAAQIDQCGACHTRRVRLHESPSREAMHETWRPELLSAGLYFPDGQIRDEVFEVGSFLQSTMAARGVTCTDCHDPHSARLKADGNALCTRCHDVAAFDASAHHFHPAGSAGAACAACHMPTRTYMVVDARRDHRLGVPRPDESEALGAPSACAACHQERTNAWAASVIRARGGSRPKTPASGRPFGVVIEHARTEQTATVASIRALVDDPATAAIVKATALDALGGTITQDGMELAQSQLKSADPLVRFGTVRALGVSARSPERQAMLIALANDPSRTVRLAVAPLVAGSDRTSLSADDQRHLDAAVGEYRRWLVENSDRAESLAALAGTYVAEGNRATARTLFEKALTRDDRSLAALLNFADFYRLERDEPRAEALLRRSVTLHPASADARFALGLLLVRQKRLALALPELRLAAELASANSYYTYVYGVGLYSSGRVDDALSALSQARTRFPANALIRTALEQYCGEPRERSPSWANACR